MDTSVADVPRKEKKQQQYQMKKKRQLLVRDGEPERKEGDKQQGMLQRRRILY